MTSSPPEDTLAAVSDEALMARVARRDRDAFTCLVRRHQAGLLNFFRRMGDSNHAEDMAQETFVRLFRYRRRYRPTARLKTFLYVLARRTWIDHCRASERRRRMRSALAEEADIARSSGSDGLLDARERVSGALGRLSEEMRVVVVMSIYQGFKYREIADVLGIPVGTVKTRMFHALRKLREILSEDGHT